jgi:hypothetical protein
MTGSARGTRAGVLALVAAVSILAAAAGFSGPASADAAAVPHAKAAIKVSPLTLSLGSQRVGTFYFAKGIVITNTGTVPLALNDIRFRGGNSADFVVATNCLPGGRPRTLKRGASCLIKVVFTPKAYGTRTARLSVSDSATDSPQTLTLRGFGTEGYFLSGVRGGVATFGDAAFHGEMRSTQLTAPIVGIQSTLTGAGYWLVGSDGGVFTFGNAKFYGSTGAKHLNYPIVGMAAPRSDKGYWLAAGDGGVFSFGPAKFYGSTGGIHLNQPIVGIAGTRSGEGYWLVARDGGVFAFGNATYFGSTGGIRLRQPIVGMARTPTGKGYWLVARDGGIFTFGDAKFYGSGGGKPVGDIVGMAPTADGKGYWLSNSLGQVYNFGDAHYFGDAYRRGLLGALGPQGTAPDVGSRIVKGVMFTTSAAAIDARLADEAGRRVDLTP